jgi:P27 family predicted phage terminase small subunit
MGGMGRPAKAAKTLSFHVTNDEKAARIAAENALRGKNDKITAPGWLNAGQRKVFNCVVEEMSGGGLLGNVDVYVLTAFAVATERVFALEKEINEQGGAACCNKDLIFARNSYYKDFWRGANELSLSPQARAKIGTLNLAMMEAEKNPLKKVLAGKR